MDLDLRGGVGMRQSNVMVKAKAKVRVRVEDKGALLGFPSTHRWDFGLKVYLWRD